MSEPVRSTARCGSPSAALKLIRAAALVAALVPLGSIAAEAGPITCSGAGTFDSQFLGTAFACETQSALYSPLTGLSNTFSFDGGRHLNTLTFDDVDTTFLLHMSAFYIDPEDLQPRLQGRECEEYALSFGSACVYYRVEDLQPEPGVQDGSDAPPEEGTHFTGEWEQEIVWFSQDGPPSDARLWHDPRDPDLDIFNDNITVPGSFESITVPPFDPLIKGRTDSFSDTNIEPLESVPEPSSLMLLGLGIGGLYTRFRRR